MTDIVKDEAKPKPVAKPKPKATEKEEVKNKPSATDFVLTEKGWEIKDGE